MDGIVVAFFVPLVVFLTFVAPIWLILHYRAKRRSGSQLSEDERAELEALADRAEHMATRIETLESILDVEAPDWRQRARHS